MQSTDEPPDVGQVCPTYDHAGLQTNRIHLNSSVDRAENNEYIEKTMSG
jgi:hypothetical protein